MDTFQIAEIVLRYLQVILGWPTTILALGILAMVLFRTPISSFLTRVTSAGGYGFQLEAERPQVPTDTNIKPVAPELAKAIQDPQTNGVDPNHSKNSDPLISYITQNPKQVIEEYLRVFNGYRFERAFNSIYGTQIDLLTHLARKGTNGEAYVNLSPFYAEFRRRMPSSSYQMADYVKFLVAHGFVEGHEASQSLMRITDLGINFLSYIQSEYPQAYSKKPY